MKMALKDHMTRQLIIINRNATAGEAHRLMINYWIRHLPVVDEHEEYIIGMLSERDLLSAGSPNVTVEKIMASPLKTFPLDTSVRTVVDAMIDEKTSAFLITRDEEVIGIVTSEDMLILLDQLLKQEGSRTWDLSELLMNPAVQRAAYLVGQAGI
ncbi:MAG: CBS domain-containing protein [Bdellovibrio sp.]